MNGEYQKLTESPAILRLSVANAEFYGTIKEWGAVADGGRRTVMQL